MLKLNDLMTSKQTEILAELDISVSDLRIVDTGIDGFMYIMKLFDKSKLYFMPSGDIFYLGEYDSLITVQQAKVLVDKYNRRKAFQ